jgi:7,8-dihydropterin-6-yl-methyl-4-(beta-D-ribofuranosyl)aminobenzene 5'-phosphate synthase
MQLTILCDNSVHPRPGLIGEHGFACHIASGNKQYLFDTGNGLGLLNNARTCGIDLTRLDAVLLSHGHWDHCGGLLELLKLREGRPTPVYAHPAIFEEKVRCDQGRERAIGPGFSRAEAESAGAVFHFSTDPVELEAGLIFSGEISRQVNNANDDRLYHRVNEKLAVDPLRDDQSLFLQTAAGLTVLCGCAHAGIRNILAHALTLSAAESIHGLIGGLHLMFTGPEELTRILQDLSRYEIQLLAVSHCTGPAATAQLWNRFAPRLTQAAVGSRFQL